MSQQHRNLNPGPAVRLDVPNHEYAHQTPLSHHENRVVGSHSASLPEAHSHSRSGQGLQARSHEKACFEVYRNFTFQN